MQSRGAGGCSVCLPASVTLQLQHQEHKISNRPIFSFCLCHHRHSTADHACANWAYMLPAGGQSQYGQRGYVQPAAAASTAAAGSGFGAKGAAAQPAAQQVLQGDDVLDLLGHCHMLLCYAACVQSTGAHRLCAGSACGALSRRVCSSWAMSKSDATCVTQQGYSASAGRGTAPAAYGASRTPAAGSASPAPSIPTSAYTNTSREVCKLCMCKTKYRGHALNTESSWQALLTHMARPSCSCRLQDCNCTES